MTDETIVNDEATVNDDITVEHALSRREEASKAVKTYMAWSTGASLIPVPLVDLATVTGLQIKMVSRLAAIYDISFSHNIAKSVIGALISSILPVSVARGTSSLIKAIPGVGTILGALTAPAFTTASTYALGRVFIQHFEAGGTLLNFDPDAMRDHFKNEFDKGAKETSAEPASKATASEKAAPPSRKTAS